MRLCKLQDDDKEVKKLRREGLSEGWDNIEEVFHYQSLLYIPKIIYSKLISKHHDNPLASYFGIKET